MSDLGDFEGGYDLLRQMQEAGVPKASTLPTGEQIDLLIDAAKAVVSAAFNIGDFVTPRDGLNLYRIETGQPCIVLDVLPEGDVEWSSDGSYADREDMIVATVMHASDRDVVTAWSVESWRFEYWEAM